MKSDPQILQMDSDKDIRNVESVPSADNMTGVDP